MRELGLSWNADKFLSTLPARGATFILAKNKEGEADFYPRSPRGERPRLLPMWILDRNFYPRSPRGERQAVGAQTLLSMVISIHAPREGSDSSPPVPPSAW